METINDIVAEMRYGITPNHRTDHELLTLYANRIEAAWKREREAAEADALTVGGVVEAGRHKPGNAAAMRDALNIALNALLGWQLGQTSRDEHAVAVAAIKTALSAPPRNCDVGTAKEQERRFNEFCAAHWSINNVDSECAGCPLAIEGAECAFAWAQMPYEEGATDGSK